MKLPPPSKRGRLSWEVHSGEPVDDRTSLSICFRCDSATFRFGISSGGVHQPALHRNLSCFVQRCARRSAISLPSLPPLHPHHLHEFVLTIQVQHTLSPPTFHTLITFVTNIGCGFQLQRCNLPHLLKPRRLFPRRVDWSSADNEYVQLHVRDRYTLLVVS